MNSRQFFHKTQQSCIKADYGTTLQEANLQMEPTNITFINQNIDLNLGQIYINNKTGLTLPAPVNSVKLDCDKY